MINFVIHKDEGIIYYMDVIETIVESVSKHLQSYSYSSKSKDNTINVHFFNEPKYINKVGLKGINVLLPHGLGDKAWRHKRENCFDYVLASSELWKSKLIERGIEKEKIFIGGYPKIDLFFDDEIKDQIKKNDKLTILWCPTHNTNLEIKYGVSSNPLFKEYVNQIPDEFNFIKHLHPFNDANHETTVVDLLNTDIVITDFSSMIYEAWILDKPVIFPDWIVKNSIMKFSGTFCSYIYEEQIGYHANSIQEVIDYIDIISICEGLDERTREFINKILPVEFRGNSGKMVADFLMELDGKL